MTTDQRTPRSDSGMPSVAPLTGTSIGSNAGQASVTVVVPCHNYGRYLADAVASVLDQEGVRPSVLIIDDASADDTHEVARRLARGDSRIEVIRHRTNVGHIATFNEGLAQASGDLVVLLSADDMLTPGALARAAQVFSAYPSVGLVYGRAVYFNDEDPLPSKLLATDALQIWPGAAWIASRCRIGRVGIVSPEVVMRTSLQHEIGGYRNDLPHAGDTEMWMRAAAHADVAFIRADQAYHRCHPASMSRKQFGTLLFDVQQRRAAFDAVLLSDVHDVPHASALRSTAMRSLAADVLWQLCRRQRGDRISDSDIEALLDTIDDFYGNAAALPEYRSLTWRRRLGRAAPFVEPLTLPAKARRRVRRLRAQYGRLWWGELHG